MADSRFQDVPPHVSALGSASSAVGRLVGGGVLLVAVIAGLLVFGSLQGGGVSESFPQSQSESGGGVSSDVAAAGNRQTELLVRTAAVGATIHVDGDSVGTAPDWQGAVAEGTRWVRVVTPVGRVVVDTLVLVRAGTQTELDVRPPGLRAATRDAAGTPVPVGTPAAGGPSVAVGTQATGQIRVTSSPAGASVQIDGRRVGQTPLLMGNLQAGRHDVVVAQAGYEDTALQVEVAAGGDNEVAVSLRPLQGATGRDRPSRSAPSPAASSEARGTVEVLVQPWGRIVIDGVPRTQETDVLYSTSLPPGEHRIEALHPTLGSKATTVMVTASGRVRVEFNLAEDPKD